MSKPYVGPPRAVVHGLPKATLIQNKSKVERICIVFRSIKQLRYLRYLGYSLDQLYKVPSLVPWLSIINLYPIKQQYFDFS